MYCTYFWVKKLKLINNEENLVKIKREVKCSKEYIVNLTILYEMKKKDT